MCSLPHLHFVHPASSVSGEQLPLFLFLRPPSLQKPHLPTYWLFSFLLNLSQWHTFTQCKGLSHHRQRLLTGVSPALPVFLVLWHPWGVVITTVYGFHGLIHNRYCCFADEETKRCISWCRSWMIEGISCAHSCHSARMLDFW